jgi:hypothetical protein
MLGSRKLYSGDTSMADVFAEYQLRRALVGDEWTL